MDAMVGQYLISLDTTYAHVVCRGRLNTDLEDVSFKLRDIGWRTTHRSLPHFKGIEGNVGIASKSQKQAPSIYTSQEA